jgi:putative ABC transport system ATP-binding protein
MAVLSLTRVSLSFPRGRRHLVRVLGDASLHLDQGEVVSVLARRAQGKTSLLRVAAGIQRPDRGRVCYEGEDLWELSSRRRARLLAGGIGWVGHAAPDLDLPMLASVALPLLGSHGKREAYALAMDALERVGASDCAEQFWDSLADWERALVALAHGIARKPKLLLVDDLTMSLGVGEADDAMELLGSLAKERDLGVLMCVSHAKATVWSDRVLTLGGGELLEPPRPPRRTGNVIDLRADPADGVRRASS